MRRFKLTGPDTLALALTAAMAAALVATMMTVAPRDSIAKPAYTQQTGSACTACHTAPPKLNACGKKWAADKSTKC